MSERLPYENLLQQQWDELPLPDEDTAWADMKQRLEEDDDDTIIAWWRRGCMGWGILLGLLLATGWWLLDPMSWFSGKETAPSTGQHTRKSVDKERQEKQLESSDKLKKNEVSSGPRIDTQTTKAAMPKPSDDRDLSDVADDESENKSTIASSLEKKDTGLSLVNTRSGRSRKKESASRPIKNQTRIYAEKGTGKSNPVTKSNAITPVFRDTILQKQPGDKSVSIITDSLPAIKRNDTTIAAARNFDTATKKETIRVDSAKNKSTFFSAGLSLYQQLPFAGQKSSPYNALGRKGSLADYIPALYFRFHKKDKWFIESEFRYGAPQYNKEFVYSEKPGSDPSGQPIRSSRSLLKTYYHQLPVSFNYQFFPGMTAGAGITWNKFSTAVFDEKIILISSGTDSLLAQAVSRSRNEKEFSSSYFQGLLQLQYQWKKISIGGRYAFGLQPYIRFTLPGEAERRERNQSLQVFLRYEFWRSKEKTKK